MLCWVCPYFPSGLLASAPKLFPQAASIETIEINGYDPLGNGDGLLVFCSVANLVTASYSTVTEGPRVYFGQMSCQLLLSVRCDQDVTMSI
jgi:hypothetical protein